MASQTFPPLAKEVCDMVNTIKEMMVAMKSKAQDIKRKEDLHQKILEKDIANLQDVSDLLSSLGDQKTAAEIAHQKQGLMALDMEIEETAKKMSELQLRVKDIQLAAAHEKQQKAKLHPRARYAVNVFRDVSKISWHRGQPSNEVKGFIRGKSSVKTFCFDDQKQSKYFITNSLWEMGDGDIW